MNEIANICEKVGANVEFIKNGIGSDSRIGAKFLNAGIGYGGSCFPKDVQAIHYTAGKNNYDFKILDAVMKVNESQKVSMVPKVVKQFGEDLTGKVFGVWGLAFKPETDDVREAPALYLMHELAKRGATFKAYDPEAKETFQRAASDLVNSSTDYIDQKMEALSGIDALIIATEWNEFREFDTSVLPVFMENPVIFDGRNLYDLETMEDQKITYVSVGRENVKAEVANEYLAI
ncbi:MAG: nucleotide sugar dehydrogenase, partial [Balneolales bacterium]|nr:nucleotide sugar dehydrogenase [Balneolales bacterium]